MTPRPAWFVFALALAWLSGCSKPAESATARPAVPAAAVAPGRYPLSGEILRIDAARKVLVVRHDPIKDYMPAMTMEFAVAEGDLALAQPGQRIRAELVPGKDGGDFRLEKIWPDERVAAETVAALALQLRQDTHARGKGAYR